MAGRHAGAEKNAPGPSRGASVRYWHEGRGGGGDDAEKERRGRSGGRGERGLRDIEPWAGASPSRQEGEDRPRLKTLKKLVARPRCMGEGPWRASKERTRNRGAQARCVQAPSGSPGGLPSARIGRRKYCGGLPYQARPPCRGRGRPRTHTLTACFVALQRTGIAWCSTISSGEPEPSTFAHTSAAPARGSTFTSSCVK